MGRRKTGSSGLGGGFTSGGNDGQYRLRLSVARNKQMVRSRNSRTILLPDNTDRSDILPCPMVSLLGEQRERTDPYE